MKKLFYALFLFLFLIPTVYAEELDVTLKDLVLKKTEGYTDVLSDAEIVDNKIVLNLKMYEVGDSAEYQFTVENKASNDLQLTSTNLVNNVNPTIVYELVGENNSNIVDKNSSKKFTLIVTYQTEVERTLFKAGKYDASSHPIFELRDPSLINPITGSIFLSLLFTIIILTIVFTVLKKYKAKYLLLGLLFLPLTVLALDQYNIELESNIIIGYVTPNPCTFDGELVQGEEYFNGQYTYKYKMENSYNNEWSNIEEDGWGVALTNRDSTDPVTTTLCTTINDKPIVSMSGMFTYSKTTSIDTSSFDTSNVTNMAAMFYNCQGLTSIDVTNFDTSKVINMVATFYGCSGLTGIDVTNFDTSNVTNMSAMFNGCSGITSIDVTNFDTSKVISMVAMFSWCSSLEELDLSGFDLSNGSTFNSIAGGIFDGNTSLKKINMSNWILPVDMSYSIFSSGGAGSSIEEIDVTGWDLTLTTNAYSMFSSDNVNGGKGLKKIKGLDTWDTSNITNMSQMFLGLSSLTTLDLSSWDTSSVTTMQNMFLGLSSLTTLDLSGWDTSNVTNISNMFIECSSITELDLSNFNTSNVTSASLLFQGCSSLVTLDISNFDLSNYSPSLMTGYFSGCSSLKKIIAKNWVIPETFTHVFFRTLNGGSSVEEIDVTGWDLSNTSSLAGVFGSGTGLKTIKGLDTWDTSHITDMSQMFYGLSSLTTLDLSSFNMNNVTNTDIMFQNCTSLTTGYARSSSDATKLNNSSGKPSGVTFVVKS